MNKSYLAAFAFALAGTASAQSSVTISGIIGVGISSTSGAQQGASNYAAGNQVKMAQDSKVPTRLVFRGTEDLGDGMSALFLLDKGFNVDDGTETLGGLYRESYVGLKGNWGTATFGRQFHPLFNVRDDYDPTADSSNLMATAGFRMNNSVMYRTPTAGGFFAKMAYGFGEVPGDMAASRAIGAYVAYEEGPISAKLGYNELKDALGQGSQKNTLAAGSYNFGPVTGFLAYGINKGAVTNGVYSVADSTDTLFGIRVPFGVHTVAATYIIKNDKTASDADATQIQLYYAYALSKRTVLYSIATLIHNSNNAMYTTAHASAAPTAAQYALGARPADREFSVGIRHSF
ncbi:MAG: porin [Herbaspirillum sp.]|jgi:predicted porin|nr:porin [Herbaspirillum sp.]